MLFQLPHRRNKYLITIPFDLAGFKAGDQVDIDDFYQVVNDAIADRDEQIWELSAQVDDLKEEINNLQRSIDEDYQPVSPYKRNGVRRSDFEGGSCYG